jgi:hypothetical protein
MDKLGSAVSLLTDIAGRTLGMLDPFSLRWIHDKHVASANTAGDVSSAKQPQLLWMMVVSQTFPPI